MIKSHTTLFRIVGLIKRSGFISNEERLSRHRLLRIGAFILIGTFFCVLLLLNRHGLGLFIKKFTAILMPFIYGFVIAYLLTPVCNRLEKMLSQRLNSPAQKKWVVGISVTLTMLMAVVLVLVLVLLLLPQLEKSIIGLAVALPGQIESFVSAFNDTLQKYPIEPRIIKRIDAWVQSDFLPAIGEFVSGMVGKLTNLVTIMKNLILGFIVAFYFLAGRKKFAAQAKLVLYGLVPQKWALPIYSEVKFADRIFSGFFIGKIIDSAIIGVICFIGVSILQLDSPLLISTIIGVTNIIPFFGPFIGAIPCMLVLLLENPIHCLTFTIFILFLQQLDGNIIGPKILGSSTGLPGFWVLFSIMLFGGLWGFVGMLIGVPLFAVIYHLGKKLILRGLEKNGCDTEIHQYFSDNT